MIFRRITDLGDLVKAQAQAGELPHSCDQGGLSSPHGIKSRKRKHRNSSNEEESELTLFRIVRIRATSPPVSEEPRINSGRTKQTARNHQEEYPLDRNLPLRPLVRALC